MRSISIEQITDEMIFQPVQPYTEINVQAKRNHRIVIDEKSNHIGIVYPNGESKEKWDCYEINMSYFFWKQYNIVQAVRCKSI